MTTLHRSDVPPRSPLSPSRSTHTLTHKPACTFTTHPSNATRWRMPFPGSRACAATTRRVGRGRPSGSSIAGRGESTTPCTRARANENDLQPSCCCCRSCCRYRCSRCHRRCWHSRRRGGNAFPVDAGCSRGGCASRWRTVVRGTSNIGQLRRLRGTGFVSLLAHLL